jgi:hypothetical protein
MSIRGQHAELRRQVLRAIVAKPGRLGLATLVDETGLDFQQVEDAVDGLRLKGMLRNNGQTLLSPTRDAIFLISGKAEGQRADQLHDLLLNKGPQTTGVLCKRMDLSRSRIVALLRLLTDEGRARQEGDGRKRQWAGVPIKSRCDPEDTALTERQQSPSEQAPAPPSNIDASHTIDDPPKEAPGKGESPVAAEATNATARVPDRSVDTPKKRHSTKRDNTADLALNTMLERMQRQPDESYRFGQLLDLADYQGIAQTFRRRLNGAVQSGKLLRSGKAGGARYSLPAPDAVAPPSPPDIAPVELDTDADTDTGTEALAPDPATEDTQEAPAIVVAMPRPEPDPDPGAEVQREMVEYQIAAFIKKRAGLVIEMAKVDACLAALRGLL